MNGLFRGRRRAYQHRAGRDLEACLSGPTGKSRARGKVELGHEMAHMRFDRALADHQTLGNLTITQAERYQCRDLTLASGDKCGFAQRRFCRHRLVRRVGEGNSDNIRNG